MKRVLILMITFAMVLCMSLTAMAEQNPDSEEAITPTTAIVATKSSPLSLRETPEQNGVILCEIPKGATVTVLEKGDWPIVEYNGQTGYVNGKYLKYQEDIVLSADQQDIVGTWIATDSEYVSFELNADGTGGYHFPYYDSNTGIALPLIVQFKWTLDGHELTFETRNGKGDIFQYIGEYDGEMIFNGFVDDTAHFFVRQNSQE